MPYIVGLTGGIGSGKSTVAQMLVDRGAVLIDADAIVHELQEPGTEVFNAMVEAFGDEIVGPDGRLDRPKVASIVFADEEKRLQLNGIVHPAVGKEVVDRMGKAGDGIVIIDVPLMTAENRGDRNYGKVIVVDARPEVQVERAVARGMQADDVRARIAKQLTSEERRELADFVIDNNGDLDELAGQVDDVWAQLQQAAAEAATA